MLTMTVHRSARRAGFTLIELLIGMILMSLVGGIIVTLLLRQQRFYNSINTVIDTRQQLDQAAALLPSELRGISSSGGDIYMMTDSAVEFRSVFGVSIACVINPGSKYITTVPIALAKGSAMTVMPLSITLDSVVNDSFAVYNDSLLFPSTDDAWSFYQVTKIAKVTGNVSSGCPTSTGLVQSADLTTSNPSYQLILAIAPSKNLDPGAAIRFFRRVHYSIYKASDGQWYLGYYDCKTNRSPVCKTIQPIAGPFQAYAANGTSGVQFAYYDSTGAATTVRANVWRISLVVRGQGAGLVNLSGSASKVFSDSLRIDVGLRNRK